MKKKIENKKSFNEISKECISILEETKEIGNNTLNALDTQRGFYFYFLFYNFIIIN